MQNQEDLIISIINQGNSTWESIQQYRQDTKIYKQYLLIAAPHSFLAFCEYIKGQSFSIQPFHKAISAIFEFIATSADAPQRVILSAPPRSGKSLLTQLYVAWLSGLNEQTAHIFASYGQRLSTKFINKINLIMTSAEYKKVFPNFCGFMAGSKTEFSSGGSIFGTSVGGAITGFDAGTQEPNDVVLNRLKNKELYGSCPGLAVVDDPLKNGESLADLETLEDWWADEFNTRRTSRWAQLLIGTRFAVNDLHAIVLNRDGFWDPETNTTGWMFLNFKGLRGPLNEFDPAGRENEDDALWPDHPTLNKTELLKLRRTDKHKFATVYQGEPSDSIEKIVKLGDIISLSSSETNDLETPENVIVSVDSATGSSEKSDNTVLSALGIVNGQPYLLEQTTCNVEIIDLRQKLSSFLLKYRPQLLVIEKASSGFTLCQEIKSAKEDDQICKSLGYFPEILADLEVETPVPRNYGSKKKRLESILDLLKITKFCWFSGRAELARELIHFGESGVADDRVDSLVWSLIFCREYLYDLDHQDLQELDENGQPLLSSKPFEELFFV